MLRLLLPSFVGELLDALNIGCRSIRKSAELAESHLDKSIADSLKELKSARPKKK